MFCRRRSRSSSSSKLPSKPKSKRRVNKVISLVRSCRKLSGLCVQSSGRVVSLWTCFGTTIPQNATPSLAGSCAVPCARVLKLARSLLLLLRNTKIGARAGNYGTRIDYVLADRGLGKRVFCLDVDSNNPVCLQWL